MVGMIFKRAGTQTPKALTLVLHHFNNSATKTDEMVRPEKNINYGFSSKLFRPHLELLLL